MKKNTLIIGILLLFFTSIGCIEQTTISEPQEYVFNYTPYNSTSYYIAEGSVKTVHVVHDTTQLDLVLPSGMSVSSKSDYGLSNIVVVDEPNASQVLEYKLSSRVLRGRKHVFIEFPESAKFVAYTKKIEGNTFSEMVPGDDRVTVQLPPEYTTGSVVLGVPKPNPDSMYEDEYGRMNIAWNGSNTSIIMVKYYKKSAPIVLTYLFIILGIAGVVVLTYFKLKIRALKKIREEFDKPGKQR